MPKPLGLHSVRRDRAAPSTPNKSPAQQEKGGGSGGWNFSAGNELFQVLGDGQPGRIGGAVKKPRGRAFVKRTCFTVTQDAPRF